jgi:hypothetical protein
MPASENLIIKQLQQLNRQRVSTVLAACSARRGHVIKPTARFNWFNLGLRKASSHIELLNSKNEYN